MTERDQEAFPLSIQNSDSNLPTFSWVRNSLGNGLDSRRILQGAGENLGSPVELSTSTIFQRKILRKMSSFPFQRLALIAFITSSAPHVSAFLQRDSRVDLGLDVDVNLVTSTLIADILCFVVGLSLIGAFGWLVGFENQLATTVALWLLVIISFTWWLSDGDNRWSLFFKFMFVWAVLPFPRAKLDLHVIRVIPLYSFAAQTYGENLRRDLRFASG